MVVFAVTENRYDEKPGGEAEASAQEFHTRDETFLVGHVIKAGDFIFLVHGNLILAPAAMGALGRPEAGGDQRQKDGGDLQDRPEAGSWAHVGVD
ncbi:MAG: hypothetical protein RL091_3627 [Verrucomicrobiota bacterium]